MEISEALEQETAFILIGSLTARERDSLSETWHVLVKYCDIDPIEPFELPIRGLSLLAIPTDPREALSKMAQVVVNSQFQFRYSKTFTPIDHLTKSSLDEIVTALQEPMLKVPEDSTWRIRLQRRHTKLSRSKIISAIANSPNAPKGEVDLGNAQWDILVEVFGEWTGLTVTPRGAILRIHNHQ
ncbi:MAG: hypothetical protein GF308_12875 [Candidatus Heimdallarchaeota archaeon]|nr:hypothetical protein [Candidatus Heimdallarchaeota archaeon]